MREMRRSDRLITERADIEEVLVSCKVIRIAVQDDEGLYIVPLNFGYVYEGDALKLYFHSAKSGRKVDALAADGRVCFEMDTDHYLTEAENSCGYGYLYSSIIGSGVCRLIESDEEKIAALDCLMNHQLARSTENMRSFDRPEKKKFSYTPQGLAAVNVYELAAESFTCKSRR